MLDKTVIITSSTTGLGYECAQSIAAFKQGWRVVIAGRSKQRLSEAAKRTSDIAPNSPVEALTLDLASLKSIRNFAWNYIPPLIRPISRFFMPMHSVHGSGQALARLVLDPSLERISGKYYSGLKEEPSRNKRHQPLDKPLISPTKREAN